MGVGEVRILIGVEEGVLNSRELGKGRGRNCE